MQRTHEKALREVDVDVYLQQIQVHKEEIRILKVYCNIYNSHQVVQNPRTW